VTDVGDRRLSAALAQEKYVEDPASQARREAAAEQRKLDWQARAERPRRPDKRQRRQIVRFTKRGCRSGFSRDDFLVGLSNRG
jgi:ribosome-associated heat shock protein Hsp15